MALPEFSWDDLIPEGYRPDEVLMKYGDLSELDDSDPRAQEALEELKQVWNAAPIVETLDGRRVRIPGFVVPLETDGVKLSEFLLVPYYGACIHVPPPPSNQVIYVTVPEGEAKVRSAFDAVWVIGTLSAKPFSSDLAQAGYQLRAESVLPYDE